MECSFTFFFCEICNVCMTYETKKNIPFFYKKRKRTQRSECFFNKEQKRTQRSFRSFIKNGKERKDRNVLLKRTDAQPCNNVTKLRPKLSQDCPIKVTSLNGLHLHINSHILLMII